MNDFQRRDREYFTNFWDNYEHLCSLQSTAPLQSIKSNVSNGTLDINADKLKSSDWDPLLNTLRVNKNMVNLVFKSTFVMDEEDTDSKNHRNSNMKLKKLPAIRNKEKTGKLCRSIRDCLLISTTLHKLELQGIPLTLKEVAIIAKGLKANKTLKILSFDGCLIGDEGLAIICRDIRSLSNLNRVNFSSCRITSAGAEILAALIKYQAMKRHNEAWKDSLRYGRPDLDSMFGIRRITVNCNPLLGDKGAEYLADAFKGDLWLKALDLQDCGITTIGANHLLEGLKFNAMMHVLDVRLNPKIDRDTLQKIMEQVMINSSGKETEYEWMALVTANEPKVSKEASNKIKKRRTINSSFSKKTHLNQVANALKLKRCKSTGSVLHNKSAEIKQVSGMPWRTAARANRHRTRGPHHQFDEDIDEENEYENDNDKDDEETEEKNSGYVTMASSSNYNSSNNNSNKNISNNNNEQHKVHFHQSQNEKKSDLISNLDKNKSLTVKDLLQVLQREQDSKTQLEYLVIELQRENTKLKAQISILQSKLESASMNNRDYSRSNLNKSLLDDDKALEIIELTLHKYQKFLDFLKNAGLGKLIQMAELDSEKEAWTDDSRYNQSSSIYQDINFNQTAQSLDVSQQNQTANASILGILKQNKRLYKEKYLKEQQQQQQQLHDTSNIDTLVTKSLEISRSYRKLNFSGINNNYGNSNNNNNSIIYETKYVQIDQENTPVISAENVPPQRSQKMHPPQQKPRRTLANSVTSTSSMSVNGNNKLAASSNDFDLQFNVDRQNTDLQKKTENLLREYSDIKKQQQEIHSNGNNINSAGNNNNRNFENLINEMYQHQGFNNGESKNGNNSHKSASVKSTNNEHKEEYSHKSDHISVKSLSSKPSVTESSKKKSESKSRQSIGGAGTAAATTVNPMINEISEIMSESMDNKLNKKKKKNKNELNDADEYEIEINGEETEEDDSDEDSDVDDDDDIEELIPSKRLQKLNIKHESTKAYNSNDEDEDDDDVDDDDNDDDDDEDDDDDDDDN